MSNRWVEQLKTRLRGGGQITAGFVEGRPLLEGRFLREPCESFFLGERQLGHDGITGRLGLSEPRAVEGGEGGRKERGRAEERENV